MKNLKVYLIKASAGSDYSEYKKKTGGPPQNIFSTAACTPKSVDIEMTDEVVGMKVNYKSDADIVAIFMSTPDAYKAYEIAKKFKAKGKTIVLGGLHTKFVQEEAKANCDAILVGEAEGIWEELLEDYRNNQLKPKYERTTLFDLAELNPYPLDIIDPAHYDYTWSVVVSRGCPYSCDFCLVPEFSPRYRMRPVENIVSEVKAAKIWGIEWCELHSDNLTVNKKFAMELFRQLKPLGMNFYAETTIKISEDEELMKAAYDAGLRMVLLGLETISKKALKEQNKGFVDPDKMKAQIEKINSFGIKVVSDFLFGFDDHDHNIFEDTYQHTKDFKLEEIFPHLLIPFPGTNTFKKFEADGRILTKDWSKYDGTQAVFQPKQMMPEDLENGTQWFWQKHNGFLKNALKSLFGSSL